MAGHIEALLILAHIASADLHPFEVDRLIFEIGIGDFTIFAAGVGEPAVAQIDTDMGDASAVFAWGAKKDEVAIDKIAVIDFFTYFRLIPGNAWDAYAHLSVDIVGQAGAVERIWPLFCPDIRLVQVLIEKFLDIFSIGFAGFGWLDDIVVGVVIRPGATADREDDRCQSDSHRDFFQFHPPLIWNRDYTCFR